MDLPETKRLNINLPRHVFDDLAGRAKASGRTITDYVRLLVGVAAIIMDESNRVMVVDDDGKPIKEIVIPR